MRNLIYLLCISLFAVSGCKKDSIPKKLNGTYKGTFSRVILSRAASNVTLTFSEGNKWTGQSEQPKYPVLCNGTYEIKGNKIIFSNSCNYTADFDWTLILNGEYNLKSTNNGIEIVRMQNDTEWDVYKLVKQ